MQAGRRPAPRLFSLKRLPKLLNLLRVALGFCRHGISLVRPPSGYGKTPFAPQGFILFFCHPHALAPAARRL